VGETRKATFVLPVALIARMRHLVDLGFAESASALVRESVEERVRQLREMELAREFEEAARDPLFLADQREVEEAFSSAVADGLRLDG
jgi:Arc/MetJ-type ribon-helix-helix transcriptional regulator